MGKRILVADDSLTIQKVIAITLASSGHDLVECTKENDLYSKLKENQFDLVLLDFNLSDSVSGHELAKKIHAEQPHCAIMVMLGTFDTVDESLFAECGINDKIVKPFESSKFIKKCAEVMSERSLNSDTTTASSNKIFDKNEDSFDGHQNQAASWRVEGPRAKSLDQSKSSIDLELEEKNGSAMRDLDPLRSEIKGWGFDSDDELEMKFKKPFPPEIIEVAATSKMTLSDLDATDPNFQIKSDDAILDLRHSIEEDISPDTFWAVDDLRPVQNDEVKDISSTHFDEITEDLTEKIKQFQESEFSEPISSVFEEEDGHDDISSDQSEHTIVHMDQDELVDKLKLSLKPIIEELVREYCKENAEKVAWEIIPDLAENLIRKEIKQISDTII